MGGCQTEAAGFFFFEVLRVFFFEEHQNLVIFSHKMKDFLEKPRMMKDGGFASSPGSGGPAP